MKNYGSVLQSLALQYKLDQLNVKNEIIQYEEYISRKMRMEIFFKLQVPKLLSTEILRKKIILTKRKKDDEIYNRVLRDRTNVFTEFVAQKFTFSPRYENIEQIITDMPKYNGILLGSDQLWCPSDLIIDYHTLSWVPEKVYKATYATSFGVARLTGGQRKKVKQFITRFSDLSVREKSAVQFLETACNINVKQVLDPTLLLTRNEWDKLLKENKIIQEKYIFCYFLSNNIQLKKWAQELKEKTGIKLVTIPHLEAYDKESESFGDIQLWRINPEDFVNLIRNAEYVLSDSFHASIFSIIYKKKISCI